MIDFQIQSSTVMVKLAGNLFSLLFPSFIFCTVPAEYYPADTSFSSIHCEVSVNSPQKEFYQVKSDKAAPNAPSNLTVTGVSFDYVDLNWDDNSDNELSFIIERHKEGEEYSRYDTVDANVSAYLDYRVEPNTTYYYRVLASNADGESAYSNEVSVATHNLPHSPPAKPTNLSGYFDGINANILSWMDNSDNEISFHLYRGTDSTNMHIIDTVRWDITLFADYGIASNQVYYYYVTAWNTYGESIPSDTIRVEVTDITRINAPELIVTNVSFNAISLAWNTITGNDVNYSLTRYSTGDDVVEFEIQSATEFTDTGLAPATAYLYYVEATDGYGNRAFSNTIEAFTLPAYTQYRVADSLIALFIFSQVREAVIPDQSWYFEPTDLFISDTSFISDTVNGYIKIDQNNLMFSTPESSLKITEACKRTHELTVECWLKTSQKNQPGVSSQIIALESDSSTAFSLSCINESVYSGKVRYFANLTTSTTDRFGNPDFTSESTTESGVLQHIVFTYDHTGVECLYLNGYKIAEGYRPPEFSTWSPTCQLVIANNLSEEEPWLGCIYMSAIYNRALDESEVVENYLASPFITEEIVLNSTNYQMAVYPNPGSNMVYLQINNEDLTNEITEEYRIRIIDNTGNVELEKVVSDYLDTSLIELDISSLNQGVHTMFLFNEHSIIDCKKLIIIR